LHLEEEEREEAFSNNMILVQQTYNEIESSSEEQEAAVVCKAQISINGDRTGKEVAMLPTAIVIINDVRNEKATARVLLDSGSQVNLMTMKLSMKLGYPIKPTNITIRGVSGNSYTPIGEITASIKSRLNAFEASLQFLVMQNVACTLPTVYPEKNIMKVINSKEYADPDVCSMRKIDMIVGTQLFFRLLCIGQIRPAGTDAIWQKTVFGWILSGHITSTNVNEKMYKQITISPEFQSYQQNLWQENRNEPLLSYKLKTVTYGTSAAPCMAIRTLMQLAECEKRNYEEASRIAKRDFYVDDLLTGAASLEEAIRLQDSMMDMYKKGGFVLRKWCSNRDELLELVPNAMRSTNHNFDPKDNVTTKTLEVCWKPIQDQFHFKVQVAKQLSSCTKCKVVSEMSRLFDPLGLVNPVIAKAKVFVQQLWKLKLSWDVSLPIEHHTAWEKAYVSHAPYAINRSTISHILKGI